MYIYIYIYVCLCHDVKNYLVANNISMEDKTSCAADGVSVMMGNKNGCVTLMDDRNPEMLHVH